MKRNYAVYGSVIGAMIALLLFIVISVVTNDIGGPLFWPLVFGVFICLGGLIGMLIESVKGKRHNSE